MAGGGKLRAGQWIEMAGHELKGVSLRLAAPFAVRGQVVVEASPGPPAPKLTSVALVPHAGGIERLTGIANWMIRPEIHFGPIPGTTLSGAPQNEVYEQADAFLFAEEASIFVRPDADGKFTLPSVYPGSYRIVPLPPPRPPYYLDAVRVGATDVAAAEVEISSGAVPIAIMYKANGGSVRGTVEKCASGPVLLVPQDPARHWLGFLRSARCDSNDRYEIAALAPGEYYALAFAGDGPLPELDDGLLNQAGKVEVRAGEATSADLRAIPRPY
jgi:hypothetical protein